MRNKKIFFIVGDMKIPGGVEKVSLLLANEFMKLNADVTIYSLYSHENTQSETPGPMVVHLSLVPPDLETMLWKKIKRLVTNGLILRNKILAFEKEEGICILQGFYAAAYLPFLKLKKTERVVCEHNTYGAPGRISRLARRILYKVYSPQLVVLTDSDKAAFNRIGINRVYKIINPNPFPISSIVKPKSENKLISLGRFTSQKRFPLMISLCVEVLKKNPSWSLSIKGQGEELETMKAEIIKSSLQSSINLLPQGNPVDLYEKGDIFLMTSAFEGLPMTLIESMSYGIPSVCFDCSPGLSEIITDGKNGFLVKMNDSKTFIDKVSELIENHELRIRMGNSARETAKKFSIPLVISEWRKIIK